MTKSKDIGAGDKIVGDRKLFNEVNSHFSDSDAFQETIRQTWDDKEAILVGGLQDSISQTSTKSQVFDPRLSTIIIERAARVMAQNPSGRAYAISKDDIGKNRFMNLYMDKYVMQNANYQYDFLIKDRMWDMYSQVYGTMFGLVDWVNDEKRNYFGPNFWLLPIRDVFPQPSAFSIQDADWIQVSSMKSMEWILEQDESTWKNIDRLEELVKEGKSSGKTNEDKDSDRRGHYEQKQYPTIPGDKKFPRVEIITEYRNDRWITFAPDYSLVLRDIKNPHKNDKIPVVAKHCFPLMDSIYGLGEVERGQTLQYAINSLINLYLDGVKMSIFPPIQINPNAQGLVPSSIKFEAAAKWFTGRPNSDIQQMQLNPQGINSFQSTYQFLVASLLNQAGTTDTTVASNVDPGQGKTPQAIQAVQARENARDNWDRFMMERALEERNKLFIDMTTKMLEKRVAIRMFKTEVDDIARTNPDVVEIFESGRAEVKIDRKNMDSKYDYEIEPGSTTKKDPEDEMKAINSILGLVLQNPQLLQVLPEQAKMLGSQPQTINLPELFKRAMVVSGLQDYDKILVDVDEAMIGEREPKQPPQGQQVPPEVAAQMQQGMPPQGAPQQPMPPQQVPTEDPAIMQAIQQIQAMGGMGNIPPQEI